MYNDWFTVDVKKRASRVRANPIGHILKELVANSLDADATNIDLTINITPNTKTNRVGMRSFTFSCTDNGTGCDDPEILRRIGSSTQDLHPETRGRFGQGLIDVICVCDNAHVETKRHRMDFNSDGCKVFHHKDMVKGMIVSGTIRHDGEGFEELDKYFSSFFVNADFTLNGNKLTNREIIRSIPEINLTTVLYSTDRAKVCKMRRNTTVQIANMHFEHPMIYEMGIPVDFAPWSLPYDINVMQKTPLDVERNMLPEAYKKTLINSIVGSVSDLYISYMNTSDNVPSEISNDRDNAEKLSDDAKSLLVEKVVGCSIDKIVRRNTMSANDRSESQELENRGYVPVNRGTLPAGVSEVIKNNPTVADKHNAECKVNLTAGSIPPITDKQRKCLEIWKTIAEGILGKHIQMGRFSGNGAIAIHDAGGISFNIKESSLWSDPLGIHAIGTLVHECAHEKVSGHNMEFCSEVERLSGRLARWVAENHELWKELEEKFFCKKEEILQEVA